MVKVLPPKPKRTTFEREGRRPPVDKAEEWRKKGKVGIWIGMMRARWG